MFELELRNNTWGSLGFKTYSDGSPEEGAYEKLLARLGYVDNEYFTFDSHKTISWRDSNPGDFHLVMPCSATTQFNPGLPWSTTPLPVSLYFEHEGEYTQLEIPPIPTIYPGKRIPVDGIWKETHSAVESELGKIANLLMGSEWFFGEDNFHQFRRPTKDHHSWTDRDGRDVDFKRIKFGWSGGYWGTFWYLAEPNPASSISSETPSE